MEACYSWSYMYDQIGDLVDEVQLARPLKSRAKIAVARKLAPIVCRVWKEKSSYYENPVALAQ